MPGVVLVATATDLSEHRVVDDCGRVINAELVDG